MPKRLSGLFGTFLTLTSVYYSELLANEQKLNNYVAGVTAPVEILSIIKDYAIYLYLAFRVLAGKITIGTFTQGFQATGQLTESVK